jgi:hypothetical protein
MSCSSFEASIVDLARGIDRDAAHSASLERHLRGCEACAARLDAERAMTAALRRAALRTVPPADAEAEIALLAAFDAHHARVARRGASRKWSLRVVGPQGQFGTVLGSIRIAVAVVTVVVVAIVTRHLGRPTRAVAPLASRTLAPLAAPAPPIIARTEDAVADVRTRVPALVAARAVDGLAQSDAAFVSWPGASALPAFESGELMRVEFSTSVALSLGLTPRVRAARVQADVLVGQDGYVRAVRLAP